MLLRIASVLVLLAVTVAAPFALRPETERLRDARTERLVIISPHIESIRAEFEAGFVRHMREKHGREVFIDWRQPGGTAEIAMFLKSEYLNSFGNLWKKETGEPFDLEARDGFVNAKLDPAGPSEDTATRARKTFLDSSAGIGIDLFFGGGAYDFDKQAAAGFLVSRDASGRYGPAALKETHPEWFSDSAIPSGASGEPFYDPQLR